MLGTRYPAVPKFSKFRWVPGYRSRRPLVASFKIKNPDGAGVISRLWCYILYSNYINIFNYIARRWFWLWSIFSKASGAWIIDRTRVFDAWESTFTLEPNWMFLDLFYWLQICSKDGEFSHKNIQLKLMKRLWGHLRVNYWPDHNEPYFNH